MISFAYGENISTGDCQIEIEDGRKGQITIKDTMPDGGLMNYAHFQGGEEFA
jgi:hypothetical protein